MQPILNQIIFKPLPTPEMTENGIFIPESAREINNKGTIVAVGNGTKKTPMKLKAGQIGYRVLNWGDGFTLDGELYFLMDQKAIIGVE